MLQLEGKSVLGIKGAGSTVQHVIVGALSTLDLQRVAELVLRVRSGSGNLLGHRQAVVCLGGVGECGLVSLVAISRLCLNLLDNGRVAFRVVVRHSDDHFDVVLGAVIHDVGVRTGNLLHGEAIGARCGEVIAREQLLSRQAGIRGSTRTSKGLPIRRQRTLNRILRQRGGLPGALRGSARKLDLERKCFRVVQLRVRRRGPGLINGITVVPNRRCKRSARKSNHHGTSKCRRNHILLQARHSHSLSFLPSRFLYPTQSQQGHNLALNHVGTYCAYLAAIDRLHAVVA